MVNAKIGVRQKIGLRIKLSIRAEAFQTKISKAVRTEGSETKMLLNSPRATICWEIRLKILAGATKPSTKPIPNKKIAIKIHRL